MTESVSEAFIDATVVPFSPKDYCIVLGDWLAFESFRHLYGVMMSYVGQPATIHGYQTLKDYIDHTQQPFYNFAHTRMETELRYSAAGVCEVALEDDYLVCDWTKHPTCPTHTIRFNRRNAKATITYSNDTPVQAAVAPTLPPPRPTDNLPPPSAEYVRALSRWMDDDGVDDY